MSFIAAVLLLNMDVADAFITFTNLLNRPCQVAFFRLDKNLVIHICIYILLDDKNNDLGLEIMIHLSICICEVKNINFAKCVVLIMTVINTGICCVVDIFIFHG